MGASVKPAVGVKRRREPTITDELRDIKETLDSCIGAVDTNALLRENRAKAMDVIENLTELFDDSALGLRVWVRGLHEGINGEVDRGLTNRTN